MNNPTEQRVLTLTTAGSLTVILQRNDGTFHQDLFGCDNGRCVEFHKVCDLDDDPATLKMKLIVLIIFIAT